MRKLISTCAMFSLLSANASSQEVPKNEVFAGYSYLRGKGASVASRADENSNMNGWDISYVRNFNDWFGLVADFSGHYNQRTVRFSDPTIGTFKSTTAKNMHLFLVGPRVSLFKTRRLSPFVQSLFGVVRANTDASESLAGLPLFKLSNTDVGFAGAFGVGLDLRINRRLAVRLVQADYVLTKIDSNRFDSENRDNIRLSAGMSFRW